MKNFLVPLLPPMSPDATLEEVRSEVLALLHRYVIVGAVAGVLLASILGFEAIRAQNAVDAVRADAKALADVNASIGRSDAAAKDVLLRKCLTDQNAGKILLSTIALKVQNDKDIAAEEQAGAQSKTATGDIRLVRKRRARLFDLRAAIDGSESAAWASIAKGTCALPSPSR